MGRGPTPFVQQAPQRQGEAVHPQVLVPPDAEARPPESRPLLHQDLRGNSVQVVSIYALRGARRASFLLWNVYIEGCMDGPKFKDLLCYWK